MEIIESEQELHPTLDVTFSRIREIMDTKMESTTADFLIKESNELHKGYLAFSRRRGMNPDTIFQCVLMTAALAYLYPITKNDTNSLVLYLVLVTMAVVRSVTLNWFHYPRRDYRKKVEKAFIKHCKTSSDSRFNLAYLSALLFNFRSELLEYEGFEYDEFYKQLTSHIEYYNYIERACRRD